MGQKYLCQEAGQPGKKGFIVRVMGEGEKDQQSSEMWWTGLASKGSAVNKRDAVINKTRLNWSCSKSTHTS